MMKAIIRYPGSKWALASWIVDHFPEGYEKMLYVEPFFGSGAVFFNKLPGKVETINDIDGEVVNLFRVIRDNPDELKRLLHYTPYSREEYNNAFAWCAEPIERARRFCVRTTQSIGAKLGSKSGWRNHKQLKIRGTACKWGSICDTIDIAAERLRGDASHLVMIENKDALQLIGEYNSPEVLLYLDPPYVRSTRKGGRIYKYEMTDRQHEVMLDALKSSKAKILLSGYECDLYDNALPGWHKSSKITHTTAATEAVETIWMNYQPKERQETFFEDGGTAHEPD